jgi:hypothetical protein
MDTFSELAEHVEARFNVVHREKFMLGIELPTGGSRRQSVFLAELKDSDDRRILRLETAVSPLGHHDPVKVLRVNLTSAAAIWLSATLRACRFSSSATIWISDTSRATRWTIAWSAWPDSATRSKTS